MFWLPKLPSLILYKISEIELFKFVKPDGWKEYIINQSSELKAIPKFAKQYRNCWTICLKHEFFKEDLSYGVLPTNIIIRTRKIGSGPFIFGKKSQKFYWTGSGDWVCQNVIKDFNRFEVGVITFLKDCEISFRN